jgi:hypothetical protein
MHTESVIENHHWNRVFSNYFDFSRQCHSTIAPHSYVIPLLQILYNIRSRGCRYRKYFTFFSPVYLSFFLEYKIIQKEKLIEINFEYIDMY